MDSSDARQLVGDYGIDRVIEVLSPFVTESRLQRIEEILDARLKSIAIVLENLHDPHNGAAAIRSIEAFGLTGLDVIETTERFRPAAKVTIGCQKWIELRRHPTVAECAASLRRRGFRLYATVPDANQTMTDIDVGQAVAVVFGNETDGLTPEAIAVCDAEVSLPMYGFTQSFNLSVSVALAVQQLARRRREYLDELGDLDDQERARLRAEWYVQSVKAAAQILDRECVKLHTEGVA